MTKSGYLILKKHILRKYKDKRGEETLRMLCKR